MPLTPKQQRFVEEYLLDLNGAAAARRAGYSERTADRMGYENLRKPEIADAIAAIKEARRERLEIKTDEVLRHWWDLATADPNELIEYRRTCCRNCHGEDYGYQRTQGEMSRDLSAWRANTVAQKKEDSAFIPEPFSAQGGIGYDSRRPPHSDCPVCFGEGVGHTFVKDTRQLSPAGRRLYAGIKETREGVEVKMHDQAVALINVAKHLGMFIDRHEVTFPAGIPLTPEQAAEGRQRIENHRHQRLTHASSNGTSTNGHAG